MEILVDSYTSELPKDVMKFTSKLAAPGAVRKPGAKRTKGAEPSLAMLEASLAAAPATPHLDHWDVKTHTYKQEIAGKVSFLANLFSGSAKQVKAGVIHEAKQFRFEKTDTDRRIEIGVSVRLSVATNAINADFDLSIPNLAAQAQLGMSEARIGISVVGYYGPVGDLLPAPDDLNVENFSIFTSAAKEIQKRVFGPEGVNFLSPTLLSFEE